MLFVFQPCLWKNVLIYRNIFLYWFFPGERPLTRLHVGETCFFKIREENVFNISCTWLIWLSNVSYRVEFITLSLHHCHKLIKMPGKNNWVVVFVFHSFTISRKRGLVSLEEFKIPATEQFGLFLIHLDFIFYLTPQGVCYDVINGSWHPTLILILSGPYALHLYLSG